MYLKYIAIAKYSHNIITRLFIWVHDFGEAIDFLVNFFSILNDNTLQSTSLSLMIWIDTELMFDIIQAQVDMTPSR